MKNILMPQMFAVLSLCLLGHSYSNDYPIALYKANTPNRNFVISPFCVAYSFGTIFLGSREQTAQEISNVFGFNLSDHKIDQKLDAALKQLNAISARENVELSFASALWANQAYAIKQSFVSAIENELNANVVSLDFSNPTKTCQMINEWVLKHTRQKINSAVSPSDITNTARLIITNSVYFKGKWKKQFSPAETKDANFYAAGQNVVKVKMMSQVSHFMYGENDNIQVLELDYIDNGISMAFILPKSLTGISSLESSLSMDSITTWSGDIGKSLVETYIPRFKFSTKTHMVQNLKAIGIQTAFEQKLANFQGIANQQDSVYIKDIIQQSLIDVKEEGTEAVSNIDAVLDGVMGLRSGPEDKPVVFRANHPFIFLIREKTTNTILFIGKVANPLQS